MQIIDYCLAMLLVGLFVQVTCFFATLSNCTLQKWQVLISAILEGSKYYFQDSKEPCIRHSCMQHTVSRETSFKDPSAPFFNVIHEMDQDLKKVPSYCPGQVHVCRFSFWANNHVFILTCPMGKGSSKSSAVN